MTFECRLEKMNLSAPIRLCATTAVYFDLKTDKNGRYYVDGLASESYNVFIQLSYAIFNDNFLLHLTTETDECVDRLQRNLSDFASPMFLYHDASNAHKFKVPVPMFLSRMSFFTGYDLTGRSLKPKECGTVFDNINLIYPSTQLWAALLVLSFILVILARIFAVWHHKYILYGKWKLFHRRQSKWFSAKFMGKKVLQELLRAYNGTSDNNRGVSFLFIVLCFYLATGFRSLYKTSQIIIEQPFVVDSYEKLLQDKTSMPIFYDLIANASQKFSEAPRDTLRGKIWSKVINSGMDLRDSVIGNYSLLTLPALVRRVFGQMDRSHFVVFAASATLDMPKTMFCASSHEDELWRFFTFADESEKEELLGYPLSLDYPRERYFVSRIRRLFESHIIIKFYKMAFDQSSYTYDLMGANNHHRNEQNRACTDEYTMDQEMNVKAIAMSYYKSFTHSILFIYFCASLLSLCEKCVARKAKARIQPLEQ